MPPRRLARFSAMLHTPALPLAAALAPAFLALASLSLASLSWVSLSWQWWRRGVGGDERAAMPADAALGPSLPVAPAPFTPEASSCRRGRPGRLLVVDDNTAVLSLERAILTEAGYAVTAVASGDAAVALLGGGERWDLVLSDVVMPGEHDGFGVAEFAGRLRPPVPVVLVSGFVPAGCRQGVSFAGFVGKPFTRAGLLSAIASVLRDGGMGEGGGGCAG